MYVLSSSRKGGTEEKTEMLSIESRVADGRDGATEIDDRREELLEDSLIIQLWSEWKLNKINRVQSFLLLWRAELLNSVVTVCALLPAGCSLDDDDGVMIDRNLWNINIYVHEWWVILG
jgi:hypothetical protein